MARARNYYYNSCHERWIVSKVIDGKKTHFGSYRNEETAKRVVEELKKINWDKTQFWKIKTKIRVRLMLRKHYVLCNYCRRRFSVWQFWWVLKFLLFGETRYVLCPYCNHVSQYHLQLNTIHKVVGSKEKKQHEKLNQIWRNG